MTRFQRKFFNGFGKPSRLCRLRPSQAMIRDTARFDRPEMLLLLDMGSARECLPLDKFTAAEIAANY
jgi:hypothetical protein